MFAGGNYRQTKGIARDGYSYGPLTDLPDWTYVEDKPTVVTKRQKLRQMKRVKMASDIARLLKEVDERKFSNTYGVMEKDIEYDDV